MKSNLLNWNTILVFFSDSSVVLILGSWSLILILRGKSFYLQGMCMIFRVSTSLYKMVVLNLGTHCNFELITSCSS